MPQEHTLVCRKEEKYILTPPQAVACRARLRAALEPDIYGGPNGYSVWSLYFDTPGRGDYYDQQNGEFERQKLRLRTYGGNLFKLECKQKRGDLQHKTSLSLCREAVQALCRGDGSVLEESAGDAQTAAFFRTFFLRGYRPQLLIAYERQAFCMPYGNIRVTLDQNVRSCETDCDILAPEHAWMPVMEGGAVVLEVKYGGTLPVSVRSLLAPWAAPRSTCSKFGRGHKIFQMEDL